MVTDAKGRVLFSNPAATTRSRMNHRLSTDGGHTWTASQVIHEGPAAYSSLAIPARNAIGLLYELGETKLTSAFRSRASTRDGYKGKRNDP